MDIRIKKGQDKRIAHAYRNRRGCRIVIHRNCGGGADCCTTGRLTLTAAQQKHLDTLNDNGHGDSGSREVSLPFTHEDLHQNGTVSGGFIPLILAALASSVAGGLIERGIAGAGFIWKHAHGACHLKTSTGGTGLHIVP